MNKLRQNLDKVILIVVGLFIILFVQLKEKSSDEPLSIIRQPEAEKTFSEDQYPEQEEVSYIHIAGEVARPGVYPIEKGEILQDVIEEAGGLTSKADISQVNLALKLEDEMKITIPEIGASQDTVPNALIEAGNTSGSKININAASKEELMSLPSIGDVRAEAIIQYREKVPFRKIEDIMNVSGIGEKTFEGIRDLIKAN